MKNELNININNSNNISIKDISQSIMEENSKAIEELVDVISRLENDNVVKNNVIKQTQLQELKNDLKTTNSSNKIKAFLLSSGKWILDFAKGVGKEVLVDYIKKSI